MVQIDVDIFEPQGISKLDAQASFLPKELAAQTIKKSFSGKKVHGMAKGWWWAIWGLLSLPTPYGMSILSRETRQGLWSALRMREAGVM